MNGSADCARAHPPHPLRTATASLPLHTAHSTRVTPAISAYVEACSRVYCTLITDTLLTRHTVLCTVFSVVCRALRGSCDGMSRLVSSVTLLVHEDGSAAPARARPAAAIFGNISRARGAGGGPGRDLSVLPRVCTVRMVFLRAFHFMLYHTASAMVRVSDQQRFGRIPQRLVREVHQRSQHGSTEQRSCRGPALGMRRAVDC